MILFSFMIERISTQFKQFILYVQKKKQTNRQMFDFPIDRANINKY